ncbi:MAG: nucleoside deaminase [Microbacteriaceae bacterium]|nr:nucleoside deaminase [Microbacteriaceae bacterium]
MSTIPATAEQLAWLAAAREQAAIAENSGDVPVGAVVVDAQGAIIARGFNTRQVTGDVAGHAEINALNEAGRVRGERVLSDCTLVVTLEPCAMCAGAILASRVGRVIFGAWDDKAGAAGSVYDLLRDGRLPHPVPEVIGGIDAATCATQLTAFFSAKRQYGETA